MGPRDGRMRQDDPRVTALASAIVALIDGLVVASCGWKAPSDELMAAVRKRASKRARRTK